MKKIFYLIILILLIVSANKAEAGFFDNWFGKTNGSTTTKQIVVEEKEVTTMGSLCFSKEMTIGSENAEVKRLQQFLLDKGLYKEGLITGYFGALTKKAVINFQNANSNDILKPSGLNKGTGYVGQATIKKLNELIGCGSTSKISSNIIPDINVNTKTLKTYNTNTTVGKKIIFDPSKYQVDVSKIDPKGLAECGPKTVLPVCAFIGFDQYQTFPNSCFTDKLGYLKICSGLCPCKNVWIAFPDGTSKPMIYESVNEPSIENIPEEVNGETTITTKNAKRYSCSLGKCIENSIGAFLTSNCDGFCGGTTKRYACNSLGSCVLNTGGNYITSNCNNECKTSNRKLLDNIFYDKTKAGGTVWYLEEKVGDLFEETLAEDRLYYPRLQIVEPNSVKNSLALKINAFPREAKSGCLGTGFLKACYEGTIPKGSGFEVVDSFSKLNTYFTVKNNSTFSSDYFDKNVLVFVFYSFNESWMDCKRIIANFRVDRVVHNFPDMDEIYNTNDTTPYNYQSSKYDTIVVKVMTTDIADNTKMCALKCMDELKYYFDVVSISKDDLKKSDGGYKKINVEFESDGGNCIK